MFRSNSSLSLKPITLTAMLAINIFMIVNSEAVDSSLVNKKPNYLPSEKYRIEEAESLFVAGEYSLGFWHCIQLFPKDSAKVLEIVCAQRSAIRNIPDSIKRSLRKHSDMSNDSIKYSEKSAVTEELCNAVENELMVHYFIDDFFGYFSSEYKAMSENDPDGGSFGQLQRLIQRRFRASEVTSEFKYLKSKESRKVKDYGDGMYSRIAMSIINSSDDTIFDSVFNTILDMMEIQRPLTLPVEGVHFPPMIIVKASKCIMLIKFRCEDLLDDQGIAHEEKFQSMAVDINNLIKGFNPKVITCGCGGPLQYLRNDI